MEEKIYKILVSREFRSGPLPLVESKKLIISKIRIGLAEKRPIKFLQFWGGCKNPNLGISCAELCEEATLNHLSLMNEKVKKIYDPGLKIYICPGDERVNRVNLISREKTKDYTESLSKIADNQKYGGLFSVIPLSLLWNKKSCLLEKYLKDIGSKIFYDIEKQPGFDKLVVNAGKNISRKNIIAEDDFRNRSIISAKNYIVCRVAEEESQIFSEFGDCIRSYFIRYSPFYKNYISALDKTTPPINCFLTFFTGRKGSVTQPWQAIGKVNDGRVLFLTQSKLFSKNNQ